jgi:DNA-binding NarL/FixJ family response regulator
MKRSGSNAVRVAVVEDDNVVRARLQQFLGSRPGLECIGTFGDAESACATLPSLTPDVVLMDIQLPRRSGIDCVKELRPALPRTQFVMLTTFDDDDLVFNAIAAGANGYLLKRATPEEILDAVANVHEGGSPITSSIARKVVQAFRRAAAVAPPPRTAPDASSAGEQGLSPREEEMLGHLARGLPYKEVADRMNISIDTVRTYVRRVYEKLQVHSRHEAVIKFRGR